MLLFFNLFLFFLSLYFTILLIGYNDTKPVINKNRKSLNKSVNERDQLRDYKQVMKLLKKGDDGQVHIVLEPNKLQNKAYGYVSSHNWAKEVKELEDINND